MPQHKKYIIANWKMNPETLGQAKKLLNGIIDHTTQKENIELVICPPHVFLCLASEIKGVIFGSQNIFWEDKGAYTGEVSAPMVKDAGARYVIIGHSERRRHLGETDASVSLKIQACLKNKLQPVVCIGENERNQEEEVKKRFHAALLGIKKDDLKKIVLVYEPVWAISGNSGGAAASFDDALSGLLFIRKLLVKMFDTRAANTVRILYGGSVDSGNASVFTRKVGFDGVLVGNASLNKNEFVKLVKSI